MRKTSETIFDSPSPVSGLTKWYILLLDPPSEYDWLTAVCNNDVVDVTEALVIIVPGTSKSDKETIIKYTIVIIQYSNNTV